MTNLSILIIGFLLGMKHATEADHLAAVATLATRQNSLAQTLQQGVAWGIGHTLTLMLFGGMVLALGRSIPQHLEQMLELTVGFMLIALGTDVLRRLMRQRIHFHAHRHHDQDLTHVHAHSHADEDVHRSSLHHHTHALPLRWKTFGTKRGIIAGTTASDSSSAQAFPLRALAVGMMHGMAGSAALILLSLGAVQSLSMGILYIALFGVGSILGMILLSVAIAIPLRLSAGYLGRLHYGVTGLIGGFSCALGAFVVYRIGFTDGLLVG